MNCQHSECDCVNASFARNGKQYCSESCATSASAGEASCGCDHPGCTASQDTSRMEVASAGADDGGSSAPSSSIPPRASASSSTSAGQPPRRPESGSTSPSPLPPSPDDRGRRKDIGSDSDRSDSSKRPDVATGKGGGKSGGPHL